MASANELMLGCVFGISIVGSANVSASQQVHTFIEVCTCFFFCQAIKEAQGKVFEANCIFAGACAPQVFVYSPGMYSSSNQDFVRGTVSSFYEMFKQTALRMQDSDASEEDLFRAFVFANGSAGYDEMVSSLPLCPF